MRIRTSLPVLGLMLASFLVGNAMSPVGAQQSGSIYTPHTSDLVSGADLALKQSDWQPQGFQIWGNSLSAAEPIVSIYFDGRVEFGPDMTQDEASRLFWTYVVEHPSCKGSEVVR